MNKSPLDYTKEDLEKLMHKEVIIEIGSRDKNKVINTFNGIFNGYSLSGNIELTPVFLKLLLPNGAIETINFIGMKDIKVIDEEDTGLGGVFLKL